MGRDDWREWASVPNLVLAALVVAVLGASMVPLVTSSASYSPYNDDWDGLTAIRSIAEDADVRVELVHGTAIYSSVSPNETVAFVLSPDDAYGLSDATRVTDFVRSGGMLIVADDYGSQTNELLRRLNASARIDGRPVRDVRSNYRSATMPIATNVSDRPLVTGVSSLTLNYGTAVEPHGATPIINTSQYAYIDADRNGELGVNENLARYPVATVERVGEGRIVVVGDSSAFINAMLDRPGNRAFARSLLSDRAHLLLDYSHAPGLPPLQRALFAVRESTAAQLGLGTLAVAAVAGWSRRRNSGSSELLSDVLESSELLSVASGWLPRTWREDDPSSGGRPDASELAGHLQRRNPDWDRERVERVVSAVERRRDEGEQTSSKYDT